MNNEKYISKPFNEKALGFKQNNPGNIRKSETNKFKGEVPSTNGFEAFKSMEYGYRALGIILFNYITKKQLNTLRQIITVFAPPFENNTDNYINLVSKVSGVNPDEILSINSFIGGLNEAVIKKIMRAISLQEVGGYDGKALEAGYKMLIESRFK